MKRIGIGLMCMDSNVGCRFEAEACALTRTARAQCLQTVGLTRNFDYLGRKTRLETKWYIKKTAVGMPNVKLDLVYPSDPDFWGVSP